LIRNSKNKRTQEIKLRLESASQELQKREIKKEGFEAILKQLEKEMELIAKEDSKNIYSRDSIRFPLVLLICSITIVIFLFIYNKEEEIQEKTNQPIIINATARNGNTQL